MKVIFIVLLIVAGVPSCKKNHDQPTPVIQLPFKPIDTINNIALSTDRPDAWITHENRISYVSFNQNIRVHGSGFNYGNYNVGGWSTYGFGYETNTRFYLRYVGAAPLLNADSVHWRGQFTMNYMPDTSLLNKPVFEARSVNNDSLYKTYVFPDSGSIWVAYNDLGITFSLQELSNDSITKAFLYYLFPAQFNKTEFVFRRL